MAPRPRAADSSCPDCAGRRPRRSGRSRPEAVCALRRLVNGYQLSQAIHVAATLGIADLLKNGPQTSDQLAAATGSHAPSLYRVLRALASVGVFLEEGARRFALTSLGEGLRRDARESVGGWAAFIGQPYYWQVWAHMLHTVRTGENAFRHVHGMDVWEYRARDREAGEVFDRAMTSLSREAAESLLAAYDFGRFDCVVDVGGGRGALLSAILARHPGVRGVLFDQPHVVAGAASVLPAAGVADRCRVVGGSFFEAVPDRGDAYVLRAILHDWEDEQAKAILQSCRRAMAADARLVVIEREILMPNLGPEGKFSDLNMLVAAGGRERTREEYAALYSSAGFRLVRAIPAGNEVSIIEGVPA